LNYEGERNIMKVIVSSIFVEDQCKALEFYEDKLGFVKKHDETAGEFRWIIGVSLDDQNGTELLLGLIAHPASKEYQQKIFVDGIPATMFGVQDIQKEYEQMREKGVRFTMEPTKMGEVTIAVFDDTCGNLIQIIQQ